MVNTEQKLILSCFYTPVSSSVPEMEEIYITVAQAASYNRINIKNHVNDEEVIQTCIHMRMQTHMVIHIQPITVTHRTHHK